MNKFEMRYSKALRIFTAISISILVIISISLFVKEIYKETISGYTLGIGYATSIFVMFYALIFLILGIVFSRRKITVDSDTITVQKVFSKSEYKLNEIYKVTVVNRSATKPLYEFSVFVDKNTYFNFSEEMTNSDLFIDILIKHNLLYRKPDGSYES